MATALRPQRKGKVQLPRITAAHRLVDPSDMPRGERILGRPLALPLRSARHPPARYRASRL